MRPEFTHPVRLTIVYLAFGAAWVFLGKPLAGLDPSIQNSGIFAFLSISAVLIFACALLQQLAWQRREQRLIVRAGRLEQTQQQASLGEWHWQQGFYWSAQALRLLRQPASLDISGTAEQLLDWLHPADRPAMRTALQALRGGADMAISVRLLQAEQGRSVWVRILGTAGENGSSSGSVQDISLQLQEEEYLRENERRLRQLVEQTPHIAVQGYDQQRRVIYWNSASERLYGFSAEKALGRKIEDLLLDDASRELTLTRFQGLLEESTVTNAEERQLRHQDGRLLRVYSSYILLRNLHNDPELYCIDVDLSEQQRIQRDLRQSEARYRELVEQLGEVVFLADAGFRLNLLNPAWETLTGRTRQNSLGQPLTQFMPTADAGRVTQQIAALRRGDIHHWHGECRLLDSAARPRWVELQLAIADPASGSLRGCLTDIHVRHQTRELQQARNAVLDELLAQAPQHQVLANIVTRLEALRPDLLVSIALLDAARTLRIASAPRLAPQESTGAALGPDDACFQAARSGMPVLVDNLPVLQTVVASQAAANGARACWSAPFKSDAGQVLGTLAIYLPITDPDSEAMQLAEEFSRLAGLAVQQQQREDARQESEQRFRSTFEQAAVGIAQLGPDGRWLRTNERLCQMLGYTREELLQLSYQELSCQQDLAEELRQAGRLLKGSINAYRLDKRYVRQNGSLLWARLSVTLARDAGGIAQYFIAVVEDLSLHKEHEQALHQAATVFNSSQEAVVIVDGRRRILSCNPAFGDITGVLPERAFGQRLTLNLQDSEDRDRYRGLWRGLLSEGHWQGELNTRRLDNSPLPLWLTANRVRGCDPQDPQYALVFSDLSQTKESQARLAQLAHFDPLTELPNRFFAMQRLGHALERAQRHHEQVAVLLLDLDHFKTVNDGLGHPVGDELLVAIARRLQQRLRSEDTLARFDGDEFMVIIENLQSPEEAALIARALLHLFENPLPLSNDQEAYLGASIGISVYPEDGFGSDELMRNADAALNQAKVDGRNTYRYYTQALTERANTRVNLESQLRKALKQGEFILHYQPLVNAQDGQPFGVEALLRWESEHGMVSPSDFIPLAEETGLIIPIGAWVLREACRQAQAWRQQGLPLQTLAVNLSPRQFRKADLLGQVKEALRLSGLPASCLELEITEGALMDDVEQATQTLTSLKQLGVHLAVDDFGTGYSSLGYLRSFPLDKLKIDQSFMRGVPEDRANLEIVTTIVTLARSLGLQLLAEGVETPLQWDTLRQLGCEQCQGYLFGRPVDPAVLASSWHAIGANAGLVRQAQAGLMPPA